MVHVIIKIKMHLIKLLLHFKLHHSDAGAGVGARAADYFEYMLISFPIRLDFVCAQELFYSVKMINRQLNALINLLPMQVHHFIDQLLPIQVLKDLLLRFFFFLFVFFLQIFELRDLILNLLFRFLSVAIK